MSLLLIRAVAGVETHSALPYLSIHPLFASQGAFGNKAGQVALIKALGLRLLVFQGWAVEINLRQRKRTCSAFFYSFKQRFF